VRGVEGGGRYVTLVDGSVWEVEYSDRATAASWTADDFVRLSWIAAPRGDFEYLLTRAGEVDQHAAARLHARARE
jgi:microcompartment protein CcmL/EutN